MTTIDDYVAETRLPQGLYQEYLQSRQDDLTEDDVPINEFSAAIKASLEK